MAYSTAFLFMTGSTPGKSQNLLIHLRVRLAAESIGGRP
jgi:hypothetical protein